MKKLVVATILIVISFGAMAQLSDALKAKNAGNDAYRNDNWIEAINQYKKYLNSDEEGAAKDANTKNLYVKSHYNAAKDFLSAKKYSKAITYLNKYMEIGGEDAKSNSKIYYFLATANRKLDNNDEALLNYQKSIEKGYREDISTYYIALIHRSTGKQEMMKQVLIEGLEKYSDSKYRKNMAALLVKPMLEEAIEPYNKGNELAKKATVDPASYVSIMAQATTKYKKAIPLLEKVLKYDPSNSSAQQALNACNDNIKAFEDYKASLEE